MFGFQADRLDIWFLPAIPMAMPISAFLSAGESFTPSPVTAQDLRARSQKQTSLRLSSNLRQCGCHQYHSEGVGRYPVRGKHDWRINGDMAHGAGQTAHLLLLRKRAGKHDVFSAQDVSEQSLLLNTVIIRRH
jgi:hypothetical protein